MTVIDFGKQPEKEESNTQKLAKTAGLIAAIVFGGAIGWAVMIYWGESIYYVVGILIGVGMTRVLAAHLASINFVKGVVILFTSMFLSLLTIALGEIIFTIVLLIFDLDYTFGISINIALVNLIEILTNVDVFIGYFTGVVGAIIGFVSVFRDIKQ